MRFLASLLVSSLAVTLCSASALPDDVIRQVDEVFAVYDRTNSPGCALGVIRDGHFVYKRGYGMANLEWGIANSPTTIFRIASVSKQFTAAAIALLAKAGKLSLDDQVQRFLPEIPRYERPVTIRHMLHHTSGLRDYLVLARLSGLRDQDYYTDGELLELLTRQQEPNFLAGDEHLYSNSGYVLLAYIVERVSGKNLKEFAHEEIFEPLGMTKTHFHNDQGHIIPQRAVGYSRGDKGFRVNMTNLEMIGDGGVFTSVEDLLAWERNFDQDRLGIVDTLHSRATLENGKPIEYAFGLNVGSYRGLKTVQHGGAFVGYRAKMLRFPEQRTSIYCLCNVAQANPSRLAESVSDILLAEHMEPKEEAVKEASSVATGEPLPAAAWEDYSGTYQVEPGVVIKVTLEDGKLFANATGQGKFELEPASRDVFGISQVAGATLHFKRDELGTVDRLLFQRGQSSLSAPRASGRELEGPDLEIYAGEYFSAELQTTYRIEWSEGMLVLKVGKLSPEPITVRDDSSASSELGQFQFEKNQDAVVSGFVLQAGRVKNLRFVKQ